MSNAIVHRLDRRHRIAAAAAATLAGTTVLAGVLALFDRAGARHWLPAEPHVLELVAACDAVADRAARAQCARDVVAALTQQTPGAARLASR